MAACSPKSSDPSAPTSAWYSRAAFSAMNDGSFTCGVNGLLIV